MTNVGYIEQHKNFREAGNTRTVCTCIIVFLYSIPIGFFPSRADRSTQYALPSKLITTCHGNLFNRNCRCRYPKLCPKVIVRVDGEMNNNLTRIEAQKNHI